MSEDDIKKELFEILNNGGLNNENRSIILSNYKHFLNNLEGVNISEKLYKFLYNPKVTYKGVKLKFISFSKGYDFTPELVNEENVFIYFEYIEKYKSLKGLQSLIKKNDFLHSFWNNIPGKTSKEKLYRIRNKLFDKVLCPICNKNKARFNMKKNCFGYCSTKCSNNSEEVKSKIKETTLKHFDGIGFQSKVILEKSKQTKLERYGDEYYNNKDKIIKTLLENYGGIGWSSKEIKEKAKQTNLEKYGFEYSLQNEEIRNKIKETNLEKCIK